MQDIDNLLSELDSSNIILKKDMFLNEYMEDCLLESYMYYAKKYENTPTPVLLHKNISEQDALNIINRFKKELIKKFRIPDTVKFEITYGMPEKEDMSLLNDDKEINLIEDDSDLYYINDDADTNRLIEQINHQNIVNSIVNSSTLCLLPKFLKEIESNKDDAILVNEITDFVEYCHYLTFTYDANLVNPMEMEDGINSMTPASERVKFNDDGTITIKVVGCMLPMILYEMLKGVIDLIAQWSFPVELDDYSQKFVRAKTTDFRLEIWEWRYGSAFFNKFIKPTENIAEYYKNLFTLNYKDLLTYMKSNNNE